MQKKIISSFILSAILILVSCSQRETESDSKKIEAVKVFNINIKQQPVHLHPLHDADHYASLVKGKIIETLATRDNDTYEWKPSLSESWEISEDGNTFTFKMRKGVFWHDGKPLTAEDVKFSFDAIGHPGNKYKTTMIRPYYENISSCEVISPRIVQFKTKKKYFLNFNVIASMDIIPRHIYQNPTQEQLKELLKEKIIGTGPYMLSEVRRGKYILLDKNKKWWGNSVYPQQENFEAIRMRFIKEENVALQRLENGDLDYGSLSAEEYIKKTSGEKWGKSVHKVKTENMSPQGYGFIAWNFKNPLFQSKNVRLALYQLIDRKKMIEKHHFGLKKRATGPWYRDSIYADPNVKPVDYDPKNAMELLKKEGWADTDGDMILDKVIDGQKTSLAFTILNSNKDSNKYLVTFQQDAKKIGVKIDIKLVEWNTFVSLINEKFEAITLGWNGGGVDNDPKQIWHSDSQKNKGSNFISYSNEKVDKLIDEARVILDKKKRIPKLREIYRLIAEDVPYAFLFNSSNIFYAHSDRVLKPKDTFKYSIGTEYWSFKKN